jgi:hypothetical protein
VITGTLSTAVTDACLWRAPMSSTCSAINFHKIASSKTLIITQVLIIAMTVTEICLFERHCDKSAVKRRKKKLSNYALQGFSSTVDYESQKDIIEISFLY